VVNTRLLEPKNLVVIAIIALTTRAIFKRWSDSLDSKS
jgi:hypothetical protein